MELIKVGLLHPREMSKNARLNLVGIREMLLQEGIPFVPCNSDGEADELPLGANVLLVVDHGSFTEQEEQAITRMASRLPLVWAGIPRADADPGLLHTLGLDSVIIDEVPHLRLIHLKTHEITAPFSHERETTLRMKFVQHIHAPCPAGGVEVADITLGDGAQLGAAAFAVDARPRRVVWTIPIGAVYCVKTSLYTDGDHLDQNDFPICTIVDVVRGMLRESVRWAAADAILARTYYWPYRGMIPRGVFSTNHDLCGYSERGVQYITTVCNAEDVRTTFFDFFPFRLTRGQVPGHEVCLHAQDITRYEDIVQQKQALQELQGVRVRGWRRHGHTAKENHPRIWRDIVRAGIEWSSTHNVQTHPFMGSAYHVATGNRLPGHPVDLEAGEPFDLVEIPCFDTGDDDRLSNFHYGPKLNWDQFVETVAIRQDYAARHNLMAAYLIHGWTAGVTEEQGTSRGALDAQRMLPLSIKMAKQRHLLLMGCDETYDWWMHRSNTELTLEGDTITVKQPSDAWSAVLELVPPPGIDLALAVGERPATPEVWVEAGRRRYLLPLQGTRRVTLLRR